MKSEHPIPETLEQYFRGDLGEEEGQAVAEHLEEDGCLRCLLVGRKLLVRFGPDRLENLSHFHEPEGSTEPERLEALERGFRQALCRGVIVGGEVTAAPELLAELERRGPEARREAIRTTERYQLLGLADYLSVLSRREVFRDVARALEVAGLAVEVADAVDPAIYGAPFVAEQRALARACLGNARRVASDLFGADQCFRQALLLAEQGPDISPIPADIGSLLGSLRIDQGRYAEARSALEKARTAYEQHEFRVDECKTLIKLADVEAYSGAAEKAVKILEEAVPLAEEVGSETLRIQAQHNLTLWMVDAGRALEALARYEEAKPLYDEHFREPSLALRRRWLEGRIYAALDERTLARRALEEVRATAAERGLSYELAMVSLELALVHLEEGDTGRVRELAEEMTPIFRSHELHRHALAAVFLFRHAAEQETATAELTREILRYLQRSRNNPYARFEPPRTVDQPHR